MTLKSGDVLVCVSEAEENIYRATETREHSRKLNQSHGVVSTESSWEAGADQWVTATPRHGTWCLTYLLFDKWEATRMEILTPHMQAILSELFVVSGRFQASSCITFAYCCTWDYLQISSSLWNPAHVTLWGNLLYILCWMPLCHYGFVLTTYLMVFIDSGAQPRPSRDFESKESHFPRFAPQPLSIVSRIMFLKA